MTAQEDPYVRVHHALRDEPDIYDSDRTLAAWLRLLIAADMAWPSAPEVPAGVRPADLQRFAESGHIDVIGRRYRFLELDAQRAARSSSWEPLWPESLWRQVQAVRGRQFRGSAGGRMSVVYPFRRIAVCDRCDKRLIGEAHRLAGGRQAGYMVCSTQRERHDCDQRGIRNSVLEDQVGHWLATLEVPEDWKEDLEGMTAGVRRKKKEQPATDRTAIENQRRRLIDLYADLHVGREEFVGRMRALEASLTGGSPQPSYFEADLVKVRALLHDWRMLWDKANSQERADIVAGLFGKVRVRDKTIVSATLADPRYAPLIASSEARRLRLVAPDAADEQVGLAPPDGSGASATEHYLRPTPDGTALPSSELASDVEGLRLYLVTALGDRYAVRVADDGSVIGLWRRS